MHFVYFIFICRSLPYTSCYPLTQGDYCQLVCTMGNYITVGQILDRVNITVGVRYTSRYRLI